MAEAKLVNNTKFPVENVRAVEKAMDKAGFMNPYLRVGILSTIAKESSFKPKNEYSYKNTSNSRLRSIFGRRLSGINEEQLTTLKNNDVAFYEKIYGGRYGNEDYGDGFKYRGRGFNQLTFRGSYEKYAKLTGHPIDKNPDLLNNVNVASDVLIAFFKSRLKGIPKEARFPVRDINKFTDQDTATYTVVSANAGWGKDVRTSHPETLQRAKQNESIFQYAPEYFKNFSSGRLGGSDGSDEGLIRRNWIPLTLIALGLGVSGFFLIRKYVWKK